MFKLFIFGLLAWALVLLFRSKRSGKHKAQSANTDSKSERVVPCQKCGLHIPESSAVIQHEQPFCSSQHAQDYASQTKQ